MGDDSLTRRLVLIVCVIVVVVCAGLALHAYREGGRESLGRRLAHPSTVAGCWSVPKEQLTADFTAITLRLSGLMTGGGKESLRGKLLFTAGAPVGYDVHGNYWPASGDVRLNSETAELWGGATTGQMLLTMAYFGGKDKLQIEFERDGEGCRAN